MPRVQSPFGTRDRSERRSLAIGLLLSAFIHVLVLVTWPDHTAGPMPRPARASPATPSVSAAMHVITITSLATERPPTHERANPPRLPRSLAPAIESPENAVNVEPGTLSPAERLVPRLGDPRIWTLPTEHFTPDHAAAARAHSAESIQSIADSARRAEEAIRRFRDWTFTDAEGRRWGISPAGQLYLGGLFGRRHPTMELAGKSQVAARFRDWGAFQNQAAQFEADTNFEQRIKAIRARKDAERKRSHTNAPPPPGR